MRVSGKFPAALLACAILLGAPAASFGQGRGEQKKDPPKEEKVVPKEEKQPKNNERPRDTDQNRGRDNNNNNGRRPPFSFFF